MAPRRALPPEPVFKASASLRPGHDDQLHAAIIADHIRRAGHAPTPSLVLRIALAFTAQKVSPPAIPVEFLDRAFEPLREILSPTRSVARKPGQCADAPTPLAASPVKRRPLKGQSCR